MADPQTRWFRPNAKQTGDAGIDGRMRFADVGAGRRESGLAVAQVKSGAVNRGDLDAFVTALDRANADLAMFNKNRNYWAHAMARTPRQLGRQACRIGDRQLREDSDLVH